MRRRLHVRRLATVLALALVLPAAFGPAQASASSVSNTSVTPSTTAAGATGVTYTVGFTTSATSSLAFPDTITLTAPAGTFTGATFSVVDVTQNGRNLGAGVQSNNGATAVLTVGSTATGGGDVIQVIVTGATNAGTGPHSFDISTSDDTTPVTTPQYTLTPAQQVSNTSVSPSTTAAGATGVTYTVQFTTSSTGQLIFPGTITLTGPAGTFTGATFSVFDVTQNRNLGAGVKSNDGTTAVLTVGSTVTGGGDVIRVTVTGATNSTAGPHTFNVSTSSDLAPVTTPPYTLGADTTPPVTTITAGPSGPTDDNTPTFAFSANEPGSTFQCRVDAAAFAPCSSPYTTAELAAGPHTFEVRATDPAGNVETTPASRNFTVNAPQPPADTTPPDTTITSGPSGTTSNTTPTFEFTSSEPGSTFQCRIDGGPFFACSSPFTTPPLAAGAHTFEVRAVDAAGNVDPSPAGTFGITAAVRTFTVQPALAPPVLAESVNVVPVKGEVLVSVPAGAARVHASATVPGLKGRRFVPLSEAKQIPVGSLLDTRGGTVKLTSARDRRGTPQSSNFDGGVFQVLQSRKVSDKGLTELRLKGLSFAACKAAKRSSTTARASRSRRTIRRLHGSGVGRFRTRGRYSAATVRGTDWTVTDRCDGTLTKVRRGTVAVRDFRRRKTVTVHAGKSYLARARR